MTKPSSGTLFSSMSWKMPSQSRGMWQPRVICGGNLPQQADGLGTILSPLWAGESLPMPRAMGQPADTDKGPTTNAQPEMYSALLLITLGPLGTRIPGLRKHLLALRMDQKESLRAPKIPSQTKKASLRLQK